MDIYKQAIIDTVDQAFSRIERGERELAGSALYQSLQQSKIEVSRVSSLSIQVALKAPSGMRRYFIVKVSEPI